MAHDTTNFTDAHNIQSVGVTDKYDSKKANINVADIKAYDNGRRCDSKFDIKSLTVWLLQHLKLTLLSHSDAENTEWSNTAKLAFGRYYKFDVYTATIKVMLKMV